MEYYVQGLEHDDTNSYASVLLGNVIGEYGMIEDAQGKPSPANLT